MTVHYNSRDIVENIYDKIIEKAAPYLDTRQNDIHVPLSYAFASRLLNHYPEADEEIVLAATLLHDIGWKAIPEDKQQGSFGPNVKNNEVQRFHEAEGARIAMKILESLNFNKEKTRHIVAIIEGHDTRQESISLEDRLVKDADKLWRYTPIGVKIDHDRFGIEWGPYIIYLETMIQRWFFTPEARQMAIETLTETKEL
jgi:putative nucleotidyltransferase with HDIG domain